ncbi:hypothetical protein [Burkholderia sp. BE12]|uniref:hypothetical protein n=1 Tax=Burkholderia sp. BE12 TaxID=2082394 RepID=UPI001319F6AF|nr:hypothetical protein [Burkholderia sp. BE12]
MFETGHAGNAERDSLILSDACLNGQSSSRKCSNRARLSFGDLKVVDEPEQFVDMLKQRIARGSVRIDGECPDGVEPDFEFSELCRAIGRSLAESGPGIARYRSGPGQRTGRVFSSDGTGSTIPIRSESCSIACPTRF